MHGSLPPKLRPSIATSGPELEDEPVKLSPLLWPLAAYLAVGTLVLFLVSQLDGLAATILPWDAKPSRWHEGSAGSIALFPFTTPILIVYGVTRIGLALPARLVDIVGGVACLVGRWVSDAWRAVRSMIRRAREALRAALYDAMRAVRHAAETTIRQVRAVLTGFGKR